MERVPEPRGPNGEGLEPLPDVGVLVVDDDDDARETLAGLIRNAGFSAATARDGREALDQLRTVRPQLILLVVVMPRMDGATFRQEQRRHRDWIRIPTIVMTGVADEPVLDVAVEDILRKPIRARIILDLVRRHCHPV